MKQTSIWNNFKFDANIKQPFVLRPDQAPWAYRFVLAAMKAISRIPTRFLRSQLLLDCNERIVEVPFVLQHLVSPLGMRILDFGCAESVLSIYLATQGAQVVGVDLQNYNFPHPNFCFQRGDFLNNEFSNSCFDAVVAVSAVEHCGLNVYGSKTYDRGDLRVVQEFMRILKPRALLIVTVPFGKRYTDDELRIYDSQQLSELTHGFWIIKRQFYRKAVEGTHWLECSEGECARAGYNPVTGVQGVALLLCEKPAEGHLGGPTQES